MKVLIECTLPRDEFRHIKAADTDPYGNLNYVLGNADDFHCFDFDFVEEKGNHWVVLHSVVNCETGGFIDDAGYEVVLANEPAQVLRAAAGMIGQAMEWCADNNIRFNSRKADHFLRDVCLSCIERGFVPGYSKDNLPQFSRRERELGGKRITAVVNRLGKWNQATT